MAAHGGQQPLAAWIKAEAAPALLKAVEIGKGWEDVHLAAARYGLEVKPRGAGLVIAVAGDKRAHIKPSAINQRLGFGPLTERFGAFQPPIGASPKAQKTYERAPAQGKNPDTAKLFERYRQDKAGIQAEHRERAQQSAQFRAEWVAWSNERRQAIKALPLTASGRKAAYAEMQKARRDALEIERAKVAQLRVEDEKRAPSTWPAWLKQQAEQGNTAAIDTLRAGDARKAKVSEAILTAADAGQARTVIKATKSPVVGRDGSVTYRLNDGGRVTDLADRVRVDEMTTASAFFALELASERFGNRPLVIGGSDAFKAELARVAGRTGLSVTFADPELERERQRQAKAAERPGREAPQAPKAPAVPDPSQERAQLMAAAEALMGSAEMKSAVQEIQLRDALRDANKILTEREAVRKAEERKLEQEKARAEEQKQAREKVRQQRESEKEQSQPQGISHGR